MDSLGYIGHATTLMRLEGSAILTDPMLRGWLGPLRRQGSPPSPELAKIPDLVLISHLHRDHLDLPSLRRLPAGTPLVAPRGATRWVARGGAKRIREIGRGETISVEGIDVTAVPAVHDGHRDRRGRQIEPLGYVIRKGGRTVYFAGDTDLFPEMSELGPLDLALLPVWGWGFSVGAGHLDPERAARALKLLRPRLAVPIHWGTFYPIGLRRLRPEPLTEPPLEFARLAGRLTPEVEVRVLNPGSETSLESK
ncbi:MAG TPA: MBL fold metallo-hydrolase [Solirubrobacterales bacterium]|jgi:L-ascorbate metabolism protein UlaG (beta-lactamase superfamily)